MCRGFSSVYGSKASGWIPSEHTHMLACMYAHTQSYSRSVTKMCSSIPFCGLVPMKQWEDTGFHEQTTCSQAGPETPGHFSSLWVCGAFWFLDFLALIIHYCVYTWCVYVGMHMWQPVWKSEDNFMESAISSRFHVGSRDWTHVIRILWQVYAHWIILLALALEWSYVRGG